MIEITRAIVRPVVTVGLTGALIAISILGATGEITVDQAKEAATIIGPLTGTAIGFWFQSRNGNTHG